MTTSDAPHGSLTDPRWRAHLELGYERRGDRTVPSLRRHVGPLRIQKHFEPEPALCEHVIVHPPAGIAGGDQLVIDVAVGPDAMTRLTTPGATRWYRSSGPQATSHLNARVAERGFLEWLPQEQIVFAGANALSALSFDLAPDASLIAWDITALGRKAGDQPFTNGTWRSRIDIARAGDLIWSDRATLHAADPLRASPLGWAGNDVLATFIATGPKQFAVSPSAAVAEFAGEQQSVASRHVPLAAMLPAARALVVDGASTGITVLSSASGSILIARLLTASVAPATAWLAALWTLMRPALIGREAHPSRIWRT